MKEKQFKDIFTDLCYEKEKEMESENNTFSYGVVGNGIKKSSQTVLNYLNGKRTPKYEHIKDIKEYFNTTYERIFGETESNKIEYIDVVDKLGLSTKAIDNLISMYKLSTENGTSNDVNSKWGYDEQEPMIPNLYMFAINRLLECDPKILYHIGNLLTYPNRDNKYLDVDVIEQLQKDEINIPNLELYSYRIAKDLEELQKEIGSTKQVAKFSKYKLKLHEKENKARNEYEESYQEIENVIKELYQDKDLKEQ